MFSKPPIDSVPSLMALVRVESLQSLATMSRLGLVTQPSTPSMDDFHAAKRRVHALLRKLDKESRLAMHSDDTGQCS